MVGGILDLHLWHLYGLEIENLSGLGGDVFLLDTLEAHEALHLVTGLIGVHCLVSSVGVRVCKSVVHFFLLIFRINYKISSLNSL